MKYEVQIEPIIGSRGVGFPAARRELLKEEIDILIVLTQELNLEVESATIFLREERRDKQGNSVWCGTMIDIYLPELDILIDVRKFGRKIVHEKGKKEPHKHKQARLAREYGYGFAIVHRLRFYNPVTLRRKALSAVMQAVEDRDRARRKYPDWWRRRQHQEFDRRFRIVVRRTG